jgi:hypothetical protein
VQISCVDREAELRAWQAKGSSCPQAIDDFQPRRPPGRDETPTTPINSAEAKVCQTIVGVSLNWQTRSAKVWQLVDHIFTVCINQAAPARSRRRPRRATSPRSGRRKIFNENHELAAPPRCRVNIH